MISSGGWRGMRRQTCPRRCGCWWIEDASCWRLIATGRVAFHWGRAAEMAGVHVGDMIEILASYGIKSNLEHEDYRQGLENLRKVW